MKQGSGPSMARPCPASNNGCVPLNKPRCQLSDDEVSQMLGSLVRRLDSVGLATQPEVACKVLDLVSNPDAQVADFAKVIRTDAALSGRLLRLVNSAYFAQARSVTSLERACSLLGIERLRSFSLGFYLSRGAASEPSEALSRRVWGQSVFRACLAAEMARRATPLLASEAFIVGLMLDSAVPLMPKLAGEGFRRILTQGEPPDKQFASEFTTLPFTHVDVATAMAMRWKLPEVLASPIARHHTPPDDAAGTDRIGKLHRIAYCVGALDLNQGAGVAGHAGVRLGLAAQTLGMDPPSEGAVVANATAEYHAAVGLFASVAESLPDTDALSARVHHQLVEILDKELAREATAEKQSAARSRFSLGGFGVQFEEAREGTAVAVLYDSTGTPLVRHRFKVAGATAESLRAALGLDAGSEDQLGPIGDYLRGMAA